MLRWYVNTQKNTLIYKPFKNYKMNISKIITVFLLLCVIAIFAINPKSEKKYYSTSVTMDYNSFVPDYHNGDTLLPDYAHTDTLVVVSAKLLNKCFANGDAGTDEEISDILGDGTVPIEDYQDYLQATKK